MEEGSVRDNTCCSLDSSLKLNSLLSVDPSEPQQDQTAAQTVKRKRGRKPKAPMDINPSRSHHKDGRAADKHEVHEEKSDSESSEPGELLHNDSPAFFGHWKTRFADKSFVTQPQSLTSSGRVHWQTAFIWRVGLSSSTRSCEMSL